MINLEGFKSPALQFSGGKDSLALLYMLRPQLHDVPVYWLNAGDTPPETLAVIDQVREWIPHFHEVKSDVKSWRDTHGYPSDIVTARNHPLGLAYGLSPLKLTPRFDCCFNNLMLPLHKRMIDDKVDAVIRGTKRCDTGSIPVQGQTPFYEVLLPLADWSHEKVFDYLLQVDAPRNSIYEHFKGASSPECLGCTAWWDDGKAGYLKANHPKQYRIYQLHLQAVQMEVQAQMRDLEGELQ